MNADVLTRFDWVTEDAPQIRVVFRRDGTGFYERDPHAGRRAVRENLLWTLEGAALRLKFAHARGWTIGLEARLTSGDVAAEARLGRHRLTFATDPYARQNEEGGLGSLELVSDAGAALDE